MVADNGEVFLQRDGEFSPVIGATISGKWGITFAMTMTAHFILLSIRLYISIEWDRAYVLEEEGR